MWSRNRSRPSSKRRLTKKVNRFNSARSVCANAIGVVDEHKLRTNGPESAAGAAAESRASARPMALAARFGVIDVITSPDRTIHHGKAPDAPRVQCGKRVAWEGSASGRAKARSWQPRRHRNLFL